MVRAWSPRFFASSAIGCARGMSWQRLGDFAFGEMKIKSKENVCTLQKSAFLVAFDALNRRSCLISAMLSRIHQAKDCGGYD
jgi:hypothetical protein